jgi:hypothetical protein
MAKYGSPHVPYILIDGYDVKSDVTEINDLGIEAVLEETHTLGDSWFESTHVGLRKATFSQTGFYDDSAGHVNALTADNTGTQRVVVVGLSPTKSVGMAGAFGAKYTRLVDRGKLHKFKVVYTVTGAVEELGSALSAPSTTQTGDWNGTAEDNGASSANGGSGYMNVVSLSGFTGFLGFIEHSPDNAAWATLIAFSNATSAPNSQRLTVSGTVDRYVRFRGDVTGAGTITVQAGFARG